MGGGVWDVCLRLPSLTPFVSFDSLQSASQEEVDRVKTAVENTLRAFTMEPEPQDVELAPVGMSSLAQRRKAPQLSRLSERSEPGS